MFHRLFFFVPDAFCDYYSVYLTPNKEDFVMKIDIEKQTISKIGQDISTLGIESRGWEIGCVGPTGLIYFIPRFVCMKLYHRNRFLHLIQPISHPSPSATNDRKLILELVQMRRGSGADYVLLLDIAGGPTPTIKLAGPDLKISSGGWGYVSYGVLSFGINRE